MIKMSVQYSLAQWHILIRVPADEGIVDVGIYHPLSRDVQIESLLTVQRVCLFCKHFIEIHPHVTTNIKHVKYFSMTLLQECM